MNRIEIRNWLVHLRLGFQLLLSPIFLWAYMLAGGKLNSEFVLGFVAFHVFGYAGGTAFNSYYDRDSGPIGGLAHPPPVSPSLLPFSLGWQMIGLGLAFAVNLPFALLYLIMFWMSVAYSHPRTRFKGRPLAAVVTVAIGQGFLAYLGGWTCARGEFVSALSLEGVLGVIASVAITTGFYPLTEVYQIDEDLRRGDLTFAAWLGPQRAFQLALACLSIGGLAAIALAVMRFGWIEASLLGVLLVAVAVPLVRWGRGFQAKQVYLNYRILMRLYATASLGFATWIGLHLFGVL